MKSIEIKGTNTNVNSLLQKFHSSVSFWWHECVWPGLGLFGESYLLFSIGTLMPFWELIFDDCFTSYKQCSPLLVKSLALSIVLGVICGMIILGVLANSLGRRLGSIVTATLMCCGAWGMTLVSLGLVNFPPILVTCMICLLFVFGVGVGGEYPMSASSANERAMAELEENRKREQETIQATSVEFDYVGVEEKDGVIKDKTSPSSTLSFQQQTCHPQGECHRGRRIQLVFTMQGMGIMCNCLVMTLLLWIYNQTGNTGNGNLQNDEASVSGVYDSSALLAIWRLTYALGAAVLSYVLISRILYLQESQVWLQTRKEESHEREDEAITKNASNNNDQQQQEYQAPDLLDTTNTSENPKNQSINVSSEVSSLSAPTIQLNVDDSTTLRDVPSTTSTQDLQSSELLLLIRNYGVRLFGASSTWFLWDVAFYGNKLFQASFLLALTGENTTLLEMCMAATLNAFVALLGYFCAATIIDTIGRLHLQFYGFLLTGALFVACGVLYESLPTSVLVGMYLLSSFFGQCGPNATTFIIAAEIFPTTWRTTCHGVAAASGKAGALVAAIVFSRISNSSSLFLWSGYASFVAACITYITIPDTTSLNLYETDKRWNMILAGRKADYMGEATMPKYLSVWERYKVQANQHNVGCDHDVQDMTV